MNLTEKYIVHLDEKDQRFEVPLDDEVAYIDYRWYDGRLMLLYVYVPVPYRGKGISNVLIRHALEYAKSKGVKINIYCPYIAKYVRTHPEYHELLDKK